MIDSYIVAREDDPWVRPADWLPISHLVTVSDEKFVGLFAVFSDKPNIMAFSVAQAYTVDWGDGTISNYASAVVAEHTYSFASISDSTLTSEGFKQVIIKVYVQSGTWTGAFIANRLRTTYSTSYVSNFIDVICSLPNTSSFTKSFPFAILKKFTWLGTRQSMTLAGLLQYSEIREVDMTLTNGTSTPLLFGFTKGFGFELGDISTTSTNVTNMFSFSTLKKMGNFTASSATASTFVFEYCAILESIGDISLPLSTNVNSFLIGCLKVKSIGNIYAPLATSATTFCYLLMELETVGTVTLTSVVTLTNFFRYAQKLKQIVVTTSSTLTSMSDSFGDAYALEDVSVSNCTNLVTLGSNFIARCYNLKTLVLQGLRVGLTIPPCQMDETAFIAFFNGLGTASGSQTIIITGNIALSPSTIAIATGKGFTVTP